MPDFLNALAQFAPYDTLDSTPFDTGTVQSMGAAQQAKPHGFLNALGQIGDVLAQAGGRTPIYQPIIDRRQADADRGQFMNSLAKWAVNPNDQQAFAGMLPNPEYAKAAFQLRNDSQRYRKDQLEQARTVQEAAMQYLGAAHDQASYDRARAHVGRLFGRYGLDFDSLGLPENYSPEVTTEIRLRGSSPKDQLGDARMNRRLDWDIEDDQLDNERMNTREADLAADRAARLAEARRYHDQADTTRRRGQDQTDNRVRGSVAYQGRASGGRAGSARPTATDKQGNKVEWNGKAWVPVK